MTVPSKQWQISRDVFERLEAKVNAAGLGIQIQGDTGNATAHGATIGWSFNGSVLSVSVIHALPFEAGIVMGRIAAAIDLALQSTQ